MEAEQSTAERYVSGLIQSSLTPSHLSLKPLFRPQQIIMKMLSHLLPVVMLPASNFRKEIYSVSIYESYQSNISTPPSLLRVRSSRWQHEVHMQCWLRRGLVLQGCGSVNNFELPNGKYIVEIGSSKHSL